MESQMGDFARKKVFKWENNIQVANNVLVSNRKTMPSHQKPFALGKQRFVMGKQHFPEIALYRKVKQDFAWKPQLSKTNIVSRTDNIGFSKYTHSVCHSWWLRPGVFEVLGGWGLPSPTHPTLPLLLPLGKVYIPVSTQRYRPHSPDLSNIASSPEPQSPLACCRKQAYQALTTSR